MNDAGVLVAFAAATFFCAGLVKGLIGFGLPTLATGILTVMMPPAQAAAIVVVPAIVTNIWQMSAGPALFALARRYAGMILGVFAGTFVTIGWLTKSPTPLAAGGVGAVLLVYGVHGLVGARFAVTPRAERWLSPFVGLVTGMLSGATGIFVIPNIPYLTALNLEKEELIQSIGIMAFVCPVALGLAIAASGGFHAAAAESSFLALLPALAGMWAGQAVRSRLESAAFRRSFFIGIAALGGYMMVRALGHALA